MFLQEAHRHKRTAAYCCVAAWNQALLAFMRFMLADVFAQALQAAELAGTELRPAVTVQVGRHAATGYNSSASCRLVWTVHLHSTNKQQGQQAKEVTKRHTCRAITR
jgi:hypothetical protein